jgi:hypothetical protein
VTKPSPQILKALMDGVRQNVATTTSLKEQLDALEQGILDLETELLASQSRVADLEHRPLFVVKKDFDPEKHLSKAGLEVYNGIWELIYAEYAKVVVPISQGVNPYSGTPMQYGQMHLKHMRFIKVVCDPLLFVLDHYGDIRALRMLQKVWNVVLDPARMATGDAAGATAAFYTQGGRQVSLEQLGVVRFNYLGVDGGTPAAGVYDNDRHALDWSLQTGTVAQVKYAMRQNLRLGCGGSYVKLRDYSLALEARLSFISAAQFPNKAWYAWGSTLRHPVESRFSWHYYEWLDTGDPKHWEAWQQLGKWLAADAERVTLADGSVLLLVSHTVNGYRNYLFPPKDRPAAQDSTYVRESVPHMLLSHMGGSPFHAEADQAAMARTLHLCVLSSGAKGSTIAATIAGNGPVSAKGQKVVFAEGKSYPTQRVVNSRPEVREGIHQVSYGLALTGSHLAKESPEFEQALRDISSTPNAHEYGRYGGRVGLMYYASERLAA